MEIHSMRIEHAVQNNAMSYAQRQQQNHRPSNHAQNAADIYKPSRSPVSTAGRYPYPTASQLHQTTPGLAQRYQQTGTAAAAYSGPAAYHRDYRQPRISLLHPEYGRGRQDAAMLPGGQAGQVSVVHLDDGMGNQQQLQPLKKIRLQDHKDNVQPLRIDTREQPGTYNPQVEAISPTLPESVQEDQPHKPTKDDIIVKIAKTDREIARAESQISILKKKQQELEELALKPQVKGEVEEDTQPRHNSLPQKIYAENRKRAASAHAQLDSLGPKVEWPLYNQPTDSTVYHENKRKNKLFKRRLLEYFKKRHAEKETRNAFLTETYSKLMQEWIRKVDKIESSTKRKAKEAKNREFFEKVFPELRKQREDKERFNRVGARVKSEADMEEIMDNLQEQAMEDKKMRSYAVIPPILLDKREKEIQYKNNNGYVEDMETMYKNRQYINMWTPQEKEIFKEKYLQHPKNFVVISSYLDRKSVADCVHYYYTSKKTENYKQLLRKSRQRTRASKNTHKVNNAANSSVVDILTTGVTTRLQREQQQKTVVREATQNQDVASTSTATSHPYSQSSTTVSTSPASSQTTTTAAVTSSSAATASNAPSPPSSSATAVISCSTPSTTAASSATTTTTSATTTTTSTTVKQEPQASPLAASSAMPPEKFTDFNSFEEYNNQMNSKGPTAQPAGGQYYGDEAAAGKGDAQPPLAEVKMEVKLENESAPEAVSDQNANAVMENKKKKERRKDKDTDAMETSEDDSLEVPEKTIQGMCIVCNAQLGTHLHSRPLPPSQASQYGLREDQVPQNGRVCNTCRCKVVRSRYTHCPLPNCPNPRGRVKRLRSFPQRLQDLPQDLKDALLAEFNIPSGVTKCCSACFNRIQRRLGPVEEWPEEEINRLKAALTELGANWQALGERLGKTPNQIRGFYSMNRKRLNLESCLGDRKPTLTDEEESGSSTSSCEDQPVTTLRSTAVAERERHSSDTASAAESPPAMAGSSQVPIKKEDYDSSATETADEAQTPDHYQGSATITPVVADGQPRQNASPLSVKDLVLNVIEFSLMKNAGNQQQGQNPPAGGGITPTISSILEQDLNDVTIVSEYSLNSQQQSVVQQQQRQVRNDMNIAKLVTPLIGATITPVTGPIPQQQPQQEQMPPGRSDLVVLQVPDTNREPETLDLSIKKPREFHQPPTLHKQQATQQAMHRQDPSPQQQYNIYHQERKSPAYVRSAKQGGSPKLGNPNPKAGSITLGTPIITQQTRYDGLLRQMPPDPKMGSITQGTPIHIPHMPGDKRVYEIYKKIGGGPQPPPQQQQPPPPQAAQGFPGQYRHQPYNVEQQLSSRQIINDYITSQQMLGRRNEKTQYYQPGGGMHRTPPPPQNQQQRQGVIQRHTRPPYLPPGHEALSSLVDVAVQQPSLPVPVTPPHEGLGKTMADNMRDQPHRFQIIQHQQNVRQQQQRLDEQRRAYHHQQVQQQQQQQQQQQHQQQQQQQQQQIQQPRQQVQRSDSSTLTAASLIDAIITHQINQTAEGGREVMQNSREPPRAGDILFQSFHRNPPPTQVQDAMEHRPPSVINVEMDSEGITKNMTVKELTDSVISHDYGARQPPPGSYYHMSQESVNEQWKRRLQQQQKENEKRSATPQQQQHDERQIIRIAQPQKYHVEPVSPPENNHWNEQSYRRFQQQPQSHMSPLDYVKNRIVEVMRTEDDKKENQENHQTEKRSESPGDMVIDEEKNEDEYHAGGAGQHQQSAYSTYPFVHKDMSVNDSGRRSNEPKPLLSAQYEPLSDED